MALNIQPLGDHIVVEPASKQEKTKGGIILPEAAKEDSPEQGKVVAVGPGKLQENGKRSPMEVKKGDKVIFKKYSPTEVELDGKEYFILSQEDILAILK
jgi:chaperonin GroES